MAKTGIRLVADDKDLKKTLSSSQQYIDLYAKKGKAAFKDLNLSTREVNRAIAFEPALSRCGYRALNTP